MLAEPITLSPIDGLSELFALYEQYQDRIPLDVLSSSLERLDLTREDLSGFSIFKSDCYCRNRLRLGASFEALLICWRPGQGSPIHDHAGSACAFRVLHGQCSETTYQPVVEGKKAPVRGPVVPVSTTTEAVGFVCAAEDADIHRVANQGTTNLQTLHVYSPPLLNMGTYEECSTDKRAGLSCSGAKRPHKVRTGARKIAGPCR